MNSMAFLVGSPAFSFISDIIEGGTYLLWANVFQTFVTLFSVPSRPRSNYLTMTSLIISLFLSISLSLSLFIVLSVQLYLSFYFSFFLGLLLVLVLLSFVC